MSSSCVAKHRFASVLNPVGIDESFLDNCAIDVFFPALWLYFETVLFRKNGIPFTLNIKFLSLKKNFYEFNASNFVFRQIDKIRFLRKMGCCSQLGENGFQVLCVSLQVFSAL